MLTTRIPSMQRLISFDISKAICIILVVIGHYHPENAPEWYHFINRLIYSFHMPLFMFASGYIYIATKKPASYSTFLWKKVERLMIPYLATSIILISIKLCTQNNAHIENPVTLSSYLKIFYLPEAGYFLWFIWALWWMFVIVPLFKSKTARNQLFVTSIILNYLPLTLTNIGCLQQFKSMLIYFMLGVFIYDNKEIIAAKTRWIKKYMVCIVFVISEILFFLNTEKGLTTIIKNLVSFTGIWVIMLLSTTISRQIKFKKTNWLLSIAASSYIIYLFHTTFEGLAKAICYKLPFDNTLWYIFIIEAIIIILCGIICPVLLYKYILQRTGLIRYLFGLKAK